MSLKDLFGALRRREQSQRASAKARYLELVAAAAAGKAVAADEAAELLANADRTAAQFETDVRAAAKRNELRVRIERAAAARPKLRQLEERAREIEAEFQAAQENFRRDAESLQAESRPLELVVSLAVGAEGELVQSCPNDELLEQYHETCRKLAAAAAAVSRLRVPLGEDQLKHDGKRLARKAEEKIRLERREPRNGWEDRVRRLEEIKADPESYLRSHRQPPLDAAEAELAELVKQREALEGAVLEA